MVLVRVRGVIDKKMLVSGAMTLEQLKLRIPDDARQRHALFMFVREKGGRPKLCPGRSLLKDLHRAFGDEEGYLNIVTQKEATF